MERVLARACRDAEALAKAGFDAVMVENFGDAPFFAGRVPAETVASLAVAADAVRRAAGLPLGVNVLRNDGESAVAIAVATQARFLRVNVLVGARVCDQGVIQTRAAELLRLRASLGAQGVALLADVGVKHSVPLGNLSLEDEALEAVERGGAEVLVVSGPRTGASADEDRVRLVKRASGAPVWLGSGVRAETLARWLEVADGVIVGSTLKRGSDPREPVDEALARAFVAARP